MIPTSVTKGRLTHIGKFLAYILRHKPEVAGLVLDNNGWASLPDLLNNKDTPMSLSELKEVCAADSKGRYILDEANQRIRAAQGHSVKVDLLLESVSPPEFLYHGTAYRFIGSIMNRGLTAQNRHHVHLSDKIETAEEVGRRHDKKTPIVLTVLAGQMALDGYKFFLSENGVYLTDEVPTKYLTNNE